MSNQEHGQVSRLASILLLGFLLPHSTGNDFFLLQNLSSRASNGSLAPNHQSAGAQTSESNFGINMIDDFVINMSLQQRLECIPQKYNPGDFGELDTIIHDQVDQAFNSFLTRALEPFLSRRPAHTKEVDLLHILAMAIHPHPSEQPIRQTAHELGSKESWEATKLLMSSLVPHNFHLNYRHRLKLVKIVSNSLLLPEFNENRSEEDAALFEGALPHLRASLYSFGLAAMSPYDSHWAQCGMVSVSIQSGIEYVVKEEWGRLLHRLVDDRTQHKCTHENCKSIEPSWSFMTVEQESFCPHRAKGQLLERFLIQFNEARHYADKKFLKHAMASLTDAIEWQVDSWTKATEDEESHDGDSKKDDMMKKENSHYEDNHAEEGKDGGEQIGEDTAEQKENENQMELGSSKAEPGQNSMDTEATSDPPCLLSSLLSAARPLFYFLLPILNADEERANESDESHQRDMLISCGIQLVHHWESGISHQASKLLALAFCYGPDEMVADYVGAIFESTKLSLSEAFKKLEKDQKAFPDDIIPFEGMVATLAKKSNVYAHSMLSLLFSLHDNRKSSDIDSSNQRDVIIFRLVAAIATANPLAAVQHLDKLTEAIESSEREDNSRMNLLAALLACRRARFFNQESDKAERRIQNVLSRAAFSGWDIYLLSRHAMVTGNFGVAQFLYHKLEAIPSSESSYLWLLALGNIAAAESSLLNNAAKGIPVATSKLRSATSSLYSLSAFIESPNVDFIFQKRFLNLRLDFLDLLTGLRQLTREMRLTGVGPKKNTRPSLHLRNTVKCFNVLATKYLTLYRQLGLFICQQSRTSLRTLHAMCRFVNSAAKSTFIDGLPETSVENLQKTAIQALTLPKGDASHPLTVLMKRLDSTVLKDMDSALEGKIRAAAMLEMIDGILRVPNPFPKDFMVTKSVPLSCLKLTIDPDSVDVAEEHAYVDTDYDEEIEITAGTSVTFFASGNIPASVMARAKLPFCIVLLWHTLTLREPMNADETITEEKQDDKNGPTSDVKLNSSIWDKSKGSGSAPTATSLSSDGTFFMKVRSPILSDGIYTVETRLGCRDVRGGEWELPLEESNHSLSVKVSRSRG